MAEEIRDSQHNESAVEEEISTGRKVAGFLLTLLLIPFLFAGACFGLFVVRGVAVTGGFAVVVLLVWVAFKVKNPGVRWGIILAALIALALATAIAVLGPLR